MACATAGLISCLSISYMLAKLSELLIHRLCSPKYVVAGLSVCSIYFSLKELPNEKIRISTVPPPVTTAYIYALAEIWQKN